MGVRSSNSWGHSFSQKLLHILAKEGPDLGHNLGGEAPSQESPGFSLKLRSFSILPTRELETRLGLQLKVGRAWREPHPPPREK